MSSRSFALRDGYFIVSGDQCFYSLQGEGVSMGEPSVFLRLHLCNLRCGYCDTPYTWNTNLIEYFDEPEDWSIEETAEKIQDLWQCTNKNRIKRLVISGGEPLIYKTQIDQLLDLLPDWQIEIETNGTIMPTKKQLTTCRFNCSPKLENSGNSPELRINREVIEALVRADSTFKFVVTEPRDLDEIEDSFVRPFNIPVEKVILMPEGRDVETLRHHLQAVAEYAKNKGYRLLSRLQIELWGNVRKT